MTTDRACPGGSLSTLMTMPDALFRIYSFTRSARQMAVAAVACAILLSGCGSSGSSSDGPVLRLHGTKPAEITLALEIGYVATTHMPGCRSFSFNSGEMEPITRGLRVWPREPRLEWQSRKEDDTWKVVKYKTLTSKVNASRVGKSEAGRDAFEWVVNLAWKGAPYGCDFSIFSISVRTYHLGKNRTEDRIWNIKAGYVGGMSIRNLHAEHGRVANVVPMPDTVKLVCKKGGYEASEYGPDHLECADPNHLYSWYSVRKENIINIVLKVD